MRFILTRLWMRRGRTSIACTANHQRLTRLLLWRDGCVHSCAGFLNLLSRNLETLPIDLGIAYRGRGNEVVHSTIAPELYFLLSAEADGADRGTQVLRASVAILSGLNLDLQRYSIFRGTTALTRALPVCSVHLHSKRDNQILSSEILLDFRLDRFIMTA